MPHMEDSKPIVSSQDSNQIILPNYDETKNMLSYSQTVRAKEVH